MAKFSDLSNLPIDIDLEEALILILVSIGLEEISLANILNAEAEKIQFVVGTLNESTSEPTTIEELLAVNSSVNQTIQNVIRKEMLLQFKLEDVLERLAPAPPPTPVPDF